MTRWNPLLYLEQGKALGYKEDFLSQLITDGRQLQSKNLPVIFTLSHLASILDVKYSYLNSIILRKRNDYRVFYISKKSGGKRQIVVPSQKLLKTQRWIAQNILTKLSPHSISTAYSAGDSPYKNASKHCGSAWLVKLDLRNFFESISEKRVYTLFKDAGYPQLLSFQLARICTMVDVDGPKKDGYLPQGSPTSPAISNLVCKQFDERLMNLAVQNNCQVSRYSDDVVFSAINFDRTQASNLIREFDELTKFYYFKRNPKKTTVVPPNSRKIVTGLKVNGSLPTLQKEYKDRIRAHLYYSKKFSIPTHCVKRGFDSIIGFKNHLEGLINFALSVEKSFGEDCKEKFEALPWSEYK